MYSVSASFSCWSCLRRALTTSPIEMIPASAMSSSTTGRCRNRLSVIDAMSSSTESSRRHVTTAVDITEATVRPSALAPCAASARTTSRSEMMPSMRRPSADTTSAPMARSRSCATASVSEACCSIVATSRPLERRIVSTFMSGPPDRCGGSTLQRGTLARPPGAGLQALGGIPATSGTVLHIRRVWADPKGQVGDTGELVRRVGAPLLLVGLVAVAEPLGLRAEVGRVVVVHGGDERQPPADRDAGGGKARRLRRVVREQLDAVDAEVVQDRRPDAVVAVIDRQPQLEVGVDRV